MILRPAIFDRHVTALDEVGFALTLAERSSARPSGSRTAPPATPWQRRFSLRLQQFPTHSTLYSAFPLLHGYPSADFGKDAILIFVSCHLCP